MVDEKALENTIEGLRGKVSSMEGEVSEARRVLSSLIHIAKLPNDKYQIDGGTGAELTEERREDIYKNCKPRADSIINTN